MKNNGNRIDICLWRPYLRSFDSYLRAGSDLGLHRGEARAMKARETMRTVFELTTGRESKG